MSDQIQIVLNVSPQETLRRLFTAIDEERIEPKIGLKFLKGPNFIGTKEFIGRIEGNHFRVRRRPRYRSSFRTFLTGVVEPLGNGSRIAASVPKQSFRVAKIILMIIGILVLVPVLLVALVTLIAWLSGNSDVTTIGGLVLMVMVVFVASFLGIASIFGGMLMFGRYQRKSEMNAIVEFVRNLYRDVTVAG